MRHSIKLSILIFLTSLSCSHKELHIAIQPYKGFEAHLVDSIAKSLQDAYQARITILPARALPENAFVNIKSPRYRADSLLKDLHLHKPEDVDYIIGLTNSDISTTKRDQYDRVREPSYKYSDWGIFGLGYMPGPSCIVSSHRLHNPDPELFKSRLRKVCIHELGHNFGLKHCPNSHCVMRDALEKISTVDEADMGFCGDCWEVIMP